jgi:thymidylate synthase
MHIEMRDMRRDYHNVLRYVRTMGSEVTIRGMETREVLDATLVIKDPTDCLPVGVGRGINPRIAAMEALQLIAGESHPDLLVRAAPNFAQFRDGGSFHGAYGPRVAMQLPRVVQRLKDDPTTRQALITVWDPLHDLMVDGRHDYPCTVSLQFMIREGQLQLHTTMRSNDVWWGLAYDAFQFTQLQLVVAQAIGFDPGPYFHHAVSMHIYERDVAESRRVATNDSPAWVGRPIGMATARIDTAMHRASLLLAGTVPPECGWYGDTMSQLFDTMDA